jgi:hypothetical protein
VDCSLTSAPSSLADATLTISYTGSLQAFYTADELVDSWLDLPLTEMSVISDGPDGTTATVFELRDGDPSPSSIVPLNFEVAMPLVLRGFARLHSSVTSASISLEIQTKVCIIPRELPETTQFNPPNSDRQQLLSAAGPGPGRFKFRGGGLAVRRREQKSGRVRQQPTPAARAKRARRRRCCCCCCCCCSSAAEAGRIEGREQSEQEEERAAAVAALLRNRASGQDLGLSGYANPRP